MKFGYVRVLTRDHNLNLQVDDLLKGGCEKTLHESALRHERVAVATFRRQSNIPHIQDKKESLTKKNIWISHRGL